MLKRIFIFVLIGAMFFVGIQFLPVFFYAGEFDDFVRDELMFAPVREDDSKEHLVEHIKQQAQYYGFALKDKDIVIEKARDTDSGLTILSADVTYASPVDLYYLTYQLRRHIHVTAKY